MIAASLREKTDQEYLANLFEQRFKNFGIYILQPKDEGQFICTENFSGVNFDLKDSAALTDFVKKYNIKMVFAEKPLNFGESSSLMIDWLKTCGLPVKLFAQRKKLSE